MTKPLRQSTTEGQPDLAAICRWIVGGYALLICIGAALLGSSEMVSPGVAITRLDAIFLATSAVTGTGLSIVDPVRVLSPLGWFTVALLSEAGLLGVLVLGALVVEEIDARFPAALGYIHRPRTLAPVVASRVMLLALGLQAIGTLLLLPMWRGAWGLSALHSIAAVGHTGFSPSAGNESLHAYRYAALTHVVIFPLMVLGGLGYPVLRGLWRSAKALDFRCLSPFVRLTLAGTAAIYLVGVLTLTMSALTPYFFEQLQLGTTSNMPVPGPLTVSRVGAAVADASFLSVSARGVGLTTVPMDGVSPAGRFVVMLLMLVGGSPGGAGGGMFVTTLAVLAVATWSAKKSGGAGEVEWGVPLRWAVAVAVYFLSLVAVGVFLMSLFEPYPFITIAFEAVSGASCTGLSLGVTGILTGFSKCVVIALMFLGRLGPLCLLAGMVCIDPGPSRTQGRACED